MTDAEMTDADRALWNVVQCSPYRNQPQDAQRHISAGANVNCQRLGEFNPASGWRETPLLIATSRGSPELVKRLLKNGADTRLLTIFGKRTILHIAAMWNRSESAGMLIEAGASLEQKDTIDGRTALHEAVFRAHRRHKTVRVLLAKGASVNATDDAGRTPLHIALEGGQRFQHQLVEILLASGADLSAKAVDGKSPYDLVSEPNWELSIRPRYGLMLEMERLRRGLKALAFAMGQQERLGAQSWVQHLEPGVVRMVLQYAG
jgi:hypothetical protein